MTARPLTADEERYLRQTGAPLSSAEQDKLWLTLDATRAERDEARAEVKEYEGMGGRCPIGHNKRLTYELEGRVGCVACERDAAIARAEAAERECAALKKCASCGAALSRDCPTCKHLWET